MFVLLYSWIGPRTVYIYLYFRTFIKYNIMVIYRVDYEQKRINEQITVPKHT